MDVDTAETLAGVVRLTRQAAVLAWAAADRASAGSSGQLFALGVDLAADQARHLKQSKTKPSASIPIYGSAANRSSRTGSLSSTQRACAFTSPTARARAYTNTNLTPKTCLVSPTACSTLWAVLPPGPTVSPNADPIAIWAAMGRAVDRSVAAGHWPGRGPKDEAWEQIASNLAQARRLLQRQVRSEAPDGRIGLTTAKTQMLHALYVAAHATTVALTGYERGLQDRLDVGARRGGSTQPTNRQPVGGAPPCAWKPHWLPGDPGLSDTRQRPGCADLVRVARVQALIAMTAVVVGEAAARRGEIDAGVIKRLTPVLEQAQLAWSRSARRWAELTTAASRTDPALVEATSQLRAAIGGAVANRTGWATAEQIAGQIDLPATVMALHRSLVAGVKLAYRIREIAADQPGLAAPARVIAMRAQGEAEVAIDQGETRFEGVRWATPDQLGANQVIPLPEPARRGLVNAATDGLRRPTRSSLQPLTSGPQSLRRVLERTVLGVSAELPPNVRSRSNIRTEEVDHDEPNDIGSH